jgi:hypothetical protein
MLNVIVKLTEDLAHSSPLLDVGSLRSFLGGSGLSLS